MNRICQNLGKDPVEMGKLNSALMKVRLEKKEKEFQRRNIGKIMLTVLNAYHLWNASTAD